MDTGDAGRVTSSDLWLTVLLVSGGLVGTARAAADQDQPASTTSYVLVLAACLPIAISARRPAWTATLTGGATVAYVGLGHAYGPIVVALVVAVYRLSAGIPIRPALAGAAALLTAGLGAVAVRGATGASQDWADFAATAACVAVPAAAGVAVKVRRDAAAALRGEQSRRAVSEERLRLAQELHDEVGHGLAVVAMHAGVALRVLEHDPARARLALEAIREASRDALDGVRAELAALRGAGPGGPALRPAGRLADLPDLAARIRAGGLPVAVETGGAVTGPGLPEEVDRAAYRIVQESLTNVLRHGGPGATARVRVELRAGTLRLEVTDTGRGAAPGARGEGIDGMRARAEALGGCVEAGSRDGGGFVVRAGLPVPGRAGAPGPRA